MVSLPMHVSESGDEGLGSMSPEPLSVITVTTEGHSVVNNEVVELRRQLERERHARLRLEKQMRVIQNQLYPERFRDNQLITYQPHEVFQYFPPRLLLHLYTYIYKIILCIYISIYIYRISRINKSFYRKEKYRLQGGKKKKNICHPSGDRTHGQRDRSRNGGRSCRASGSFRGVFGTGWHDADRGNV